MSVLTQATVGEFRLADTLCTHDGLQAEIERAVPLGGRTAPALWLRGLRGVEPLRLVERDSDIERAEVLETTPDATLLAVEWTDSHPLVETLAATDGTCLEAVGRNEGWELRLRFPTHDQLATFYHRCVGCDIPVTVQTVHSDATTTSDHLSAKLSDQQRETLRRAFELGYFAVPRETTLQGLAAELDISDTAASQRIRRGLQTLLTDEPAVTRPRPRQHIS